MGSLANAWELVDLDLLFGPTTRGATATVTVPATLYIALFTTLPADDGTGGVEVSTGSYARPAVTNNATNWPAATIVSGVGTKQNGTTITFPTASGSWGTPPGFGIFDALTVGTLIAYGAIASPVPIVTGNAPFFAPGAITITSD